MNNNAFNTLLTVLPHKDSTDISLGTRIQAN